MILHCMGQPRKTLLTTSRNPTPMMRTFCHDLARVMPNVVYVNRGKMSNDDVAEKAIEHDADRVMINDRGQSGLGVLRLCRVGESGLTEASPKLHFAARLQREFGVSNVKTAGVIIVEATNRSDELARLAASFSGFLGLPVSREEQEHKSALATMSISRGEPGKIVVTFMAEPGHIEVGPRITVSRLEW